MLSIRAARFIMSQLMRYPIGLHVTLNNYKKVVWSSFLLIILACSVVSVSFGLRSSSAISSTGMISYWPHVDIYVELSNTIGFNNLSLGFQLSYGSLGSFQKHSELRLLAKDAQFKLVRFFDGLTASHMPSMMPCTYFDEATKTGTYNWTTVDDVVRKIFEIGAEPLVCLGVVSSSGVKVPPGMAINPQTGLPYPESYASYCAEWVKHFKAKNWPVRFYEICNEVWVYFGQNPVNTTKLGCYMELFRVCREAMKKENPDVIVSFDFIHKKPVLDYWLSYNGPDVDSLNFHKYDEWRNPPVKTEEQIIRDADKLEVWYSIVEAQQIWYQQRGKRLPMICSESNFNGASPTTDERIQQMVGAVWLALLLRTEILSGVSYHIYFELSSSYYADAYGFGMINNDGFKPWYPYYVQHMIGNNLAIGDSIVYSYSSSDDVRSLAWIHQETLNILLINKVNQNRTVHLHGVTGTLNLYKIDNTIPWTTPSVQTDIINSSQPLIMQGYTVALLQMSAP